MPGHAGGAPGRAPMLEADTESPQKLKCLPQARKALSCTVLVNVAVIGRLLGLRASLGSGGAPTLKLGG